MSNTNKSVNRSYKCNVLGTVAAGSLLERIFGDFPNTVPVGVPTCPGSMNIAMCLQTLSMGISCQLLLPFVERVQQHITSFQPIDISADGHVICVSDTAETIYVKKTWVVPVSIMLYATVLDEQVYLQAFDEKSTLRWAFRYPAQENMQLSALAQKCKDFMVARDTMSALAPVLFVGSRNGEILTGRYGVITADFWQTTCNKTMSHRG